MTIQNKSVIMYPQYKSKEGKYHDREREENPGDIRESHSEPDRKREGEIAYLWIRYHKFRK